MRHATSVCAWAFCVCLALGVGLHAQEGPLPAEKVLAYKKEPGPFAVLVDNSITWRDEKRDRAIPALIYAPQDAPGRLPVLIFSHGLGGSREGYAYVGRHWASHGYVCVHLQHAGSDTAVIWGGMDGILEAGMSPRNWRDRPQDVSFALDQLAALDREHRFLKGRLDLERIGVAGHSFGAYTALASIGLLVTCPGEGPKSFRDKRVRAAVAMSPPGLMGGALGARAFEDLTTPCLYLTGTADESPVFTTRAGERRTAFDRSPVTDAFLITLKDAAHFAFSDNEFFPGLGRMARVPAHHDYIRMTTTAFWDAYLKGDAQAQAWLTEGGFEKLAGDGAKLEKKNAKAAAP